MVNLVWHVMFCYKHLAPLKAKWPQGSVNAMIGLFNAASENELIKWQSGYKAENLPLVFDVIKPVCCYLPEGKAEEVVRLALEGKVYGRKE